MDRAKGQAGMITIETLRDQIDAMERMGNGNSMLCKKLKRRLLDMVIEVMPKKTACIIVLGEKKRDKNGRFCK